MLISTLLCVDLTLLLLNLTEVLQPQPRQSAIKEVFVCINPAVLNSLWF